MRTIHPAAVVAAALFALSAASGQAVADEAELSKCLDAVGGINMRELSLESGDDCETRRRRLEAQRAIVRDIRGLRAGACNSSAAEIESLLTPVEANGNVLSDIINMEQASIVRDCR